MEERNPMEEQVEKEENSNQPDSYYSFSGCLFRNECFLIYKS